jgi:hypothetical protein
MQFIQDIFFPGWTALETVAFGDQVFACAMTFAAVILVGLRDV